MNVSLMFVFSGNFYFETGLFSNGKGKAIICFISFSESDHRNCAGIHRSHCRIVFYG